MSRKSRFAPRWRECSGSLQIPSVRGRVEYSVEKAAAIVAGTMEGGTRGVEIDLHRLKEAIDFAIEHIFPGTPKNLPCIVDVWLDTADDRRAPMVVVAGEPAEDGRRPCVVVAADGMVEEGDDE